MRILLSTQSGARYIRGQQVFDRDCGKRYSKRKRMTGRGSAAHK